MNIKVATYTVIYLASYTNKQPTLENDTVNLMHFNRDSLIFLHELPKQNKSKKVQVGKDNSKNRGRKNLIDDSVLILNTYS